MKEQNKYEKIRTLITTVKGNRFVVSEWEKNVQVWDIDKGYVALLETDIVSGMSSAISISEDGNQLAIAGYDHRTVTLYDIDSRKICWQRKDIKKPATVAILNYRPNLIFVDTENQGAFLLDLTTGETIEKLRGVEYIRESSYSTVDQLEKSSMSILVDRINNKKIKTFKHKSFAILDACFSPDKIFCSYSTNPLESISLITFEPLWETIVSGHFLEIEYCQELDKLLGIRWEYEKGGPKFLCYINLDNGEIEQEICIGDPIESAFLKCGSFALTSQGTLYSTKTGQPIKQFDFEKSYE